MVSGRVECGSLAGIFLLAYGNDCRLENPFQNENLPFYVVELADFLAPNDPGRAAWAELRKQQAKAAQEGPYVTLIKNSDTGEWNDIHPLDKKTPATRLVEAVIQNEKQNK